MKLNIIIGILPALMLFAVTFSPYAEAAYQFRPESVLAEGKWVRVTTGDEGIYEISYDDLREMGFDDPRKVGVYGKGAAPLPLNFKTSTGLTSYKDDLSPVAVRHSGDRIYFYAAGDVKIEPEYSGSGGACIFRRTDRNIYSRTGTYFLTDCGEHLSEMAESPLSAGGRTYTKGYDYFLHESDLVHNTTRTGQLFWGESLPDNGNCLEWTPDLQFLEPYSDVRMRCRIYAEDDQDAINMKVRFGIRSSLRGNASYTYTKINKSTASFMPLSMSEAVISVASGMPRVFVEASDVSGSYLNLDYWLLSYSKKITDFKYSQTGQETLWLTGSEAGFYELKGPSTLCAFDITDAANPKSLEVSARDGICRVAVAPEAGISRLIMFDGGKRQMRISGYETVANQNLHAMAADGADLLIVATEPLMPAAERIAELHRRHQNLKVCVVEMQSMFNEFSGGVPDAMAYRALVKMFYESGKTRLRNLLLVGPETGDYRKQTESHPEQPAHIGFQSTVVSRISEAGNMLDFYGITVDAIKSETTLQNEQVDVGVGILPFSSLVKSETYVRKIEEYLTKEDFSPIVNKMLIAGGAGDNHMHDGQAVQMSKYHIDSYAPAPMMQWPLAITAYGDYVAKEKFVSALNDGNLFAYYFGHSGPTIFHNNWKFFTNADAMKLRNRHLGFLFSGSCDLTVPDHAVSGLGDILVTEAVRGFMGVICASRTVWSSQNFNLGKCMVRSMFMNPGDKRRRTVTPTAGEIYAEGKNRDTNSNKLSYIFVGDPALPVPVPVRRVALSLPADCGYAPGESVEISGEVITLDDNERDRSFSGFVTLRLAEPERTVISHDYMKKEQSDSLLKIPLRAIQMSEYKAKVSDGRFTVRISVPKEASQFTGESLGVYAGVYDPATRTGGNGWTNLAVGSVPAVADNLDTTPPGIAAVYDEAYGLIEVRVSDDNVLPDGCLRATGKYGSLQILSSTLYAGDSGGCEQVSHIPADEFEEGGNSLNLKATDMAGNTNEYGFSFEKRGRKAPLALRMASKAVWDIAEFTVESAGVPLSLTICDSNGVLLHEADVVAESALWNCEDRSGRRVPPGIYRARVRSTGTADPVYSDWVSFGVVY